MLLRIEKHIKFPSVGHIYYEVPDKSVVDDAQQMIEELCRQKLRTMYGVSSLGQERLNRELNNMAETETAFQYLLLKDIVDRSRAEHAPVFCYDPGSLIPFLLGATPVNPLPPHYRCLNCGYVEEVTGIKDGYDLLPKTCPVCGNDLDRDGHDCSDCLYWTNFRKRKRRPSLAVHITDTVFLDLQKVLFSKYSKLPSSEGIYQDIELEVSESVSKISQLSGITSVEYQSCDVHDKEIWKDIAKSSFEQMAEEVSIDLPSKTESPDSSVCSFYKLFRVWAFCRGTFTDNVAPVYVMKDEIEEALRESGLPDVEAAFLAHRAAWGKAEALEEVPPHLRDGMRPIINVWSKGACISKMLSEYSLRWYEKYFPEEYKQVASEPKKP